MADFIRARSAEHKEQRLAEVKRAAAALFAERPYPEITLSTIAGQLSWSRANLYKYVRTKEEVFLSLAEDARDAYVDALLAAFSGCGELGPAEAADRWAGVLVEHEDWFRYLDLLFTIIESNVSHERLVAFKRGYYEELPGLRRALAAAWGVPSPRVARIMSTVGYQAVGLIVNACATPQVQAALGELGVEPEPLDARAELADFIEMVIEHERARA